MADPPSPTLEAVHAAATVGKRFESLLKRGCKNFEKLIEFKAVVDRTLRRERVEELSGDERNRLLDAVEEYDKIEDSLAGFLKSTAYEEFRGWSRYEEELIKWVGEERLSVGYCGVRERGKQYFLMDIPLEGDLPFEKKVADLFEVYRVSYLMPVPSQEEAERMLLDFLEWVTKRSRTVIGWVVKSLYPLNDDTGGFWSVVTKVMALPSLRDAWEDIIDDWTREAEAELEKMPQFQVMKELLGEWEAERYVKRLVEDVKKEFTDRYADRLDEPEEVKKLFLTALREDLAERVAPEDKLREVYEEIKPLVPADKVELTRAGLLKAIRWAFMHPQLSVDAFASAHVFPLGFTTEEARAIGSKVMEKVTKKPPVIAPPPPPPKLSLEEFRKIYFDKIAEQVHHFIELYKPGLAGELHYAVPEREKETVALFTFETVMSKRKEEFEADMKTAYGSYETFAGKGAGEAFLGKWLPERLHHVAADLTKKTMEQLLEEAKKPKPPIEYVEVRFLTDAPSIVGADMKTYGPFKRWDLVKLPRDNVDIFADRGITTRYPSTMIEVTGDEIEELWKSVKKPIIEKYHESFKRDMKISVYNSLTDALSSARAFAAMYELEEAKKPVPVPEIVKIAEEAIKELEAL